MDFRLLSKARQSAILMGACFSPCSKQVMPFGMELVLGFPAVVVLGVRD
jgi:hypothetical protein